MFLITKIVYHHLTVENLQDSSPLVWLKDETKDKSGKSLPALLSSASMSITYSITSMRASISSIVTAAFMGRKTITGS
jgi:hypothetical protein